MKRLYKKLIIILTSFFLVSCGRDQPVADEHEHEIEKVSNKVSLTKEQYSHAEIELGGLTQRSIGSTVKASGKLDVPPQQMVSVSLPIGGFIKHTKMLIGDRVNKGQILAKVENLDYVQIQQDYLDVKSQFEYAEKEYERQQTLAKENVNAKKKLQQAKSNYYSFQAKFRGLQSKLKLMNIDTENLLEGEISSSINVYAPISGHITDVGINVGKYAAPEDVLFRIVNTEHMHVELTVFEKDVTKLKVGQQVKYRLANENKEHNATVHLIGKEVSDDRTVRVHCHLDDEDTNLIPGMYLTADVAIDEKTIPSLPNSAIVEHDEKSYIFVLMNQSPDYNFKMEEVEIGLDDGQYSEIINSKVFAGKKVVVQGAYSLLSVLNVDDEEGHNH